MSASTDLLYAAARAAGYQVARVSDDGESLLLVGMQEPWNPRADDGDALRLAAKLYLWQAIMLAHRLVSADMDIYAATRRAIVLAAAEIGRALQLNHESPSNSKLGCTGGGG